MDKLIIDILETFIGHHGLIKRVVLKIRLRYFGKGGELIEGYEYFLTEMGKVN